MKLRFSLIIGMAVMIVAAACGGGQPEEVAPAVDSAAIRDSLARLEAQRRAYEDSVRRAREEAERLRREREEAEARARALAAEVRNMVAMRIHFDFDKSAIRPGTDADVMQQKLEILQANPALRLEIVGHCDERGSDEYNLALGERRALAAKNYLVSLGVTPENLNTITYGEENPFASGHDEEAWAKSRRAEFNIVL